MMSNVLKYDRTTVGFRFKILIILEKIKGGVKASIKIWMWGGWKYDLIFRGEER